ncbi:hypothetical protein DICA0_D13190 [Diutina catenulata]
MADSDNARELYEVREGIVFLVEVTPDLVAPVPELMGESQAYEILSSINVLIKELMMINRNTGIGIYFYGCENDALKPPFQPMPKAHPMEGLAALFTLNYINVTDLTKLNEVLADHEQNVRRLSDVLKPAEWDGEELPRVFEVVMENFQQKRYFNRKKLVWVTNNDKPFLKRSTEQTMWRMINDCYNFGYDIKPLFLSNKTGKFDKALYQAIFLNTNYMNDETQASLPTSQYADQQKPLRGSAKVAIAKDATVSNRIRQYIMRIKQVKRQHFACPLVLSDGATIAGSFGCSIKGYTLYSEEKPVKRDMYVHGAGGAMKRVFTESEIVDTETGTPIDLSKEEKGTSYAQLKEKHQVRRGVEISGDVVIPLSQETWQFLQNFAFDHNPSSTGDGEDGTDYSDDEDEVDDDTETGDTLEVSRPPYLKLVGFRDLETYRPWYNFGPPTFISVDFNEGAGRGGYTNSFATFSSLYQGCLKLQRYAVVFGCLRKSSKPALYALYPTHTVHSSKFDKPGTNNGNWDFPEGFLLMRLPWLDDIRSLPTSFVEEVGADAVNEAYINTFSQIIQNLSLSYVPESYPNPTLNYWYKMMMHELLGQSVEEGDSSVYKNDVTMRQLASIYEVLQNQKPELRDMIDSMTKHMIADAEEEASNKRSSGSSRESNPKRSKGPDPYLDDDAVLSAYKSSSGVGVFTVPQLRGYQQRYRDEIPSCNKKQDYVDAIEAFIARRLEAIRNSS